MASSVPGRRAVNTVLRSGNFNPLSLNASVIMVNRPTAKSTAHKEGEEPAKAAEEHPLNQSSLTLAEQLFDNKNLAKSEDGSYDGNKAAYDVNNKVDINYMISE